MIESILIGTTNTSKIRQLRDCLALINIDGFGVKDKSLLPYVEEDGKTVEENAEKKAIAYAKEFGQLVISMDNELHIDGLPDELQPGIHVRRINGKDTNSDEELLNHFERLISSLGERVTGHWRFGVCIAKPNGEHWTTVIVSPRVFTKVRSVAVMEGYPLESIQIDPKTGKYVAEMSEEEHAKFWQDAIGSGLIKFVQSIDEMVV